MVGVQKKRSGVVIRLSFELRLTDKEEAIIAVKAKDSGQSFQDFINTYFWSRIVEDLFNISAFSEQEKAYCGITC